MENQKSEEQQMSVDVVEEEFKATDTTCEEPANPEPWLEITPPLQENLSFDEYLARPGPSWADLSDLDFMTWNRSPNATPGRHNLGGDTSVASELAVQTSHRSYYASRHEFQRSSRHTPYDISKSEHSRTTALRKSRFVRYQTRDNEYQSQFSSLANPALYPIHQHPAPETEQYQTIRQLLDPNYSTTNSPQRLSPRSSSQYTSQSPPTVQFPSSPPKIFPISTTPDTHRSPSSPFSDLFDMSFIGAEPAPQPLDLSVLKRQLPTLIPISQAMSTRPAQVRSTVRSTPRTHTVTSTLNSLVYIPSTLFPNSTYSVESQQSTDRIEFYSSCSEHLLNRPTTRRARTPTDPLPEHLQYQTWPVDYGDYTDHVEVLDTSDCDAWFESIQCDSLTSAAAAPQTSVPTTNPPPAIIIEHVSPTSPETIATTSPPRSTSS